MPVMVVLFVAAFALGLVLDVVDTLHKVAIEKRHAHGASRASVSMFVLGIISSKLALDESMWLVLPMGAGLYLGSWYAVTRAHKNESKSRVI